MSATPLADEFVRDLTEWRIRDHMDSAASQLLDQVEANLEAARTGSMTAYVAVFSIACESNIWLRQFEHLLRQRG